MIEASVYKSLRNVPISATELVSLIGDSQSGKAYQKPSDKLASLENNGEVIQLKKGLYVLDAKDYGFPVSAPICSNHIYGPSYLSQQWALSYYGLIPERVSVYSAITIKHGRRFENKLGLFTYSFVNRTYFRIGLRDVTIDGTTCLVASPEKALVDLILFDNYVPSRSMRGLYQYLEEDIRFDIDELKEFDTDILRQCAECGRKREAIGNLIKIIERL